MNKQEKEKLIAEARAEYLKVQEPALAECKKRIEEIEAME